MWHNEGVSFSLDFDMGLPLGTIVKYMCYKVSYFQIKSKEEFFGIWHIKNGKATEKDIFQEKRNVSESLSMHQTSTLTRVTSLISNFFYLEYWNNNLFGEAFIVFQGTQGTRLRKTCGLVSVLEADCSLLPHIVEQ